MRIILKNAIETCFRPLVSFVYLFFPPSCKISVNNNNLCSEYEVSFAVPQNLQELQYQKINNVTEGNWSEPRHGIPQYLVYKEAVNTMT